MPDRDEGRAPEEERPWRLRDGPQQPGRWVWQPDTDQAAQESFRRLKEWTIDHGLGETGARIFRELRDPALTPEQRAALHEKLHDAIRQKRIEDLEAERRRRPLWRDGHPPWERSHP